MAALVQLNSTLPQDIEKKHGVTVNGFHDTSTTIRFDGTPSAVETSRKEVDDVIMQAKVTTLTLPFPISLFSLAKRQLKTDNCPIYIGSEKLQENSIVITLCSFDEQTHKKAITLLQNTPLKEEVEVSSTVITKLITDRLIKQLEEKYCIVVEQKKAQESQDIITLVIAGFHSQTVKHAHKELLSLVKQYSEQRVTLGCKPEEVFYLLRVISKESRSLFSSLPAKVTIRGDVIELHGNLDCIEKSRDKILNGPLCGLQCRRFSFKCNLKFQFQIESCVLKPLKIEQKFDFQYLTVKPELRFGSERCNMPATSEQSVEISEFDIVIYSKDKSVFDKICEAMEVLDPQTRHIQLSYHGAADCARKVKDAMESKYLLRMIVYKDNHGLIIHGLIPDKIQQCWEDINDEIRSNIETTKHINNIKRHEWRYLEKKCSNDLKKEFSCDIAFPQLKKTESYAVRIAGKIKDVEAAQSKVSKLLEDGIQLITFSISCSQKSYQMWRKWWYDFQVKEKESHNVIIDFDVTERRTTREGRSINEVSFQVIGTDVDHLRSIRDTINNEIVEKRVIDVEEGKEALLNAVRQNRLPISEKLAIAIDIDPYSNKVTLVSPKSLADDLNIAESEIRKFVGMYANISKEIGSYDPVVGLILTLHSLSTTYVKSATDIAKLHKVNILVVGAPVFGLKLTGSPSAIQRVEPQIRAAVLQKIEATVGQTQIVIPSTRAALLTASDFSQFEMKLENDYCVLLSYPKQGSLSKAEYTTTVKANSSSHSVVLDICHGDIVHERVDAIVNAANEDLKHIGGLAKSISDHGGVTIQSESSKYVKSHGKVPTGSCVCLGAGKLPCKRIIHAVGPQWRGGGRNEEQTLYNTVYQCLKFADRENIKSIALPAISTGVYGVPEEVCARASLTAVCDYCKSTTDSNIGSVRFILYTKSALKHFGSAIKHCTINPVYDKHFPSLSATKAKETETEMSTSISWSWGNDTRSYSAYDSDVSTMLTKAYEDDPHGTITCNINGQQYRIDFSKMIQTNASTGFQRKVRRITSARVASPTTQLLTQTVHVHWKYRDDHHGWSLYTSNDSDAIEVMYQDKTPGELTIVGNTYTFDFDSMHQINVRTNYKRKIMRVEEDVPKSDVELSSESEIEIATNTLDEDKGTDNPEELLITLRGPRDSLQQAKSKLEEKLKSMYVYHTVTFPPVLEKKLSQIAKEHKIICSFEKINQSGSKKKRKQRKLVKLKLEGLASKVASVAMAIQEEIITHQIDSETEGTVEYPEEWEEMGPDVTTKLFHLNPGTDEWTCVAQKFRETMPLSNIYQITRIQNIWLWGKYFFHQKRLSIKNNGNINELDLFHGTSTIEPRVIYESEVGFDMRYSSTGMWGQANYFAEKASYSDRYAHRTIDGFHEMFYAKVLTGDSNSCSPDPSLRKPPFKATSSTEGGLQFAQVQYDTVTGYTKGSQVYMTYDNEKAYPAYLIKYR